MLDSASQSASAFWHACADVAIATVAGGLVLLVFYPIAWCAGAVKRLPAVLGLHIDETRARAARQFASCGVPTEDRQRDSRQSHHVAHS